MVKKVENIYMKRFLYFNTYVIKGEDGDVLIDTGFKFMRRRLKKWLDNFDVKLIILTHAHVDHTWNASYLKKLYDCEIALCRADIKNIDNSHIDSTPSNKKFSLWSKLMNYGMRKYKAEPYNIDIELEDQQELDCYGLNLKIESLKGHTDGSIGIMYKDYLFAGDALVYRGKYATAAYQNQDNYSAKETVNKIIELNPKLIFIGHDKILTVDKIRKE